MEKIKMNKKKDNKNKKINYFNTSTIAPNISTSNICYSYQKLLEEPTNKEILSFIKKNEF